MPSDDRYDRAITCALDAWNQLETSKRRDKPHVVAVMTFSVLETLRTLEDHDRDEPRDSAACQAPTSGSDDPRIGLT